MRLTLNVPKVEQFMQNNDWDEKKLAQSIGVSKVQVYRVLRGQREPGNEFIAGVLFTFGANALKEFFIFEPGLPKGNKVSKINKRKGGSYDC